MKHVSKLLGIGAIALALTGCDALKNLTPNDVNALLAEAGLELRLTDNEGQARTLKRDEIKAVYLDGKPLSADQYDVVDGKLKFRDVPKNKQQKVRIEFNGDMGTLDGLDLDTREGRAFDNREVFVPGADGRFHEAEPGMTPEEAFKRQREEDLKHRITLDLNVPGLKPGSVRFFGGAHSRELAERVHALPPFAFDVPTDGDLRMDVQVLNLTGPNPSDVLDVTWFVAFAGEGSAIKVQRFKIEKGDLKRQEPATGKLPDAQLVSADDIELVGDVETFADFAQAGAHYHFELPPAPPARP
ncbi:hypothetical protein J7643_09555 [bacterium]|nr:hypothetical protein [bacterium]